MERMVLRRATLEDRRTVDVVIEDGRITSVDDAASAEGVDLDLGGYVLLAAPVEPHAHLDKAFLADLVLNETGDLMGAILAMDAARSKINVAETMLRAERAARLMAANGFRAVRTHVDVNRDNGIDGVEALGEVRRRLADVIDIQLVALAAHPIATSGAADSRGLVHDAIEAGADLVGGCPHLEPDGNSLASTEALLGIASEHGVGVDLHTDETLEPSADGLAELAAMVTATGFEYPVTASHCVSLGARSESDQQRIAGAVAAAGIAVVALPATNLYLQGRAHLQSTPRGVTAVRALRAAGATVAAGADNLHDPFNPFGRACPFETASLMVLTTHLLPAEAWHTVTDDAAAAIGLDRQTIAPGQMADLLAVRAGSLREAIAFGPADRIVWRAGQRQDRL
ncbi:MAG: amidohydrolase family protein [Actinomycetota bacterium]|nr:amidohydrolase family protein [Actinomycetota bacterium]